MTDLVLNKNFYNYVGCIMFGGASQSGPAQIGTAYAQGLGYQSSKTYPGTFVDVNNSSFNGLTFNSSSGSPSASWNHTLFVFKVDESLFHPNIRFICGTDSTPATVNNIALIAPNDNITATIETGKRDTTTSIVYTVAFTSSSQQTLREIGIVRNLYNYNENKTTLLGRAVLDDDIILNEDNGYSVTLQIRISLPIPA